MVGESSTSSAMAPVALSTTSAPIPFNARSSLKSTPTPSQILDAPARSDFAFDSIEDALAAFAAGEFLVVMDDENRENEGDLIISASKCSTEKMAWMIKHTRSVVLS